MCNLKFKSFRTRGVFVLMIVLAFLVGFLCVAFKIQMVEGLVDICIKAGGSVVPSHAPISSVDNVTYVLNASIGSLVVERDNIIVDGAGYTIQGPGYDPCTWWDGTGVNLVGRENVTVKNLEIWGFLYGMYVRNGSNCALYCSRVISNFWGIGVVESSNTTICGSNVTANDWGIILFNCSKSNMVFSNYLAENWENIYFHKSSDQILSGNVINTSDNSFCFDIVGSEPRHFVHSIYASNLVNGKPVYYLVNQTDLVLTSVTHPQVGYLVLANCTNITVDGLSLADTGPLLMLAYTTNSTIANTIITNSTNQGYYSVLLESSYNNTFTVNNITENDEGIYIRNSSFNTFSANNFMNNGAGIVFHSFSANNTLIGNNIANNGAGIGFERSCNNTLAGNTIIGNECGIFLTCSSSNSIYENNITGSSGCGIYIAQSSDNSFYHNNFLDNPNPVELLMGSEHNFWDDGYPSGGNYWSGYSDTDMYSGPYQNETGSDGIWDHPYVLNAENQDNYPTVPECSASIIFLVTMISALITIVIRRKMKDKQYNTGISHNM
jgi:parallel beta-helix repeat protein